MESECIEFTDFSYQANTAHTLNLNTTKTESTLKA